MARKIRLTRIFTETQDIAEEIGRLQFHGFHGSATEWAPDVNAFRYEDRFEVCVDLAGVTREEIELTVLPNSLTIQGTRRRPVPECPDGGGDCRLTLAMEISTGPFFRRLTFPQTINPERVTARQENGLLWISLPLETP